MLDRDVTRDIDVLHYNGLSAPARHIVIRALGNRDMGVTFEEAKRRGIARTKLLSESAIDFAKAWDETTTRCDSCNAVIEEGRYLRPCSSCPLTYDCCPRCEDHGYCPSHGDITESYAKYLLHCLYWVEASWVIRKAYNIPQPRLRDLDLTFWQVVLTDADNAWDGDTLTNVFTRRGSRFGVQMEYWMGDMGPGGFMCDECGVEIPPGGSSERCVACPLFYDLCEECVDVWHCPHHSQTTMEGFLVDCLNWFLSADKIRMIAEADSQD